MLVPADLVSHETRCFLFGLRRTLVLDMVVSAASLVQTSGWAEQVAGHRVKCAMSLVGRQSLKMPTIMPLA